MARRRRLFGAAAKAAAKARSRRSRRSRAAVTPRRRSRRARRVVVALRRATRRRRGSPGDGLVGTVLRALGAMGLTYAAGKAVDSVRVSNPLMKPAITGGAGVGLYFSSELVARWARKVPGLSRLVNGSTAKWVGGGLVLDALVRVYRDPTVRAKLAALKNRLGGGAPAAPASLPEGGAVAGSRVRRALQAGAYQVSRRG